MVDLEGSSAPAEASSNNAVGLCRLCLRHDKSIANIFEEMVDQSPASPNQKTPLVERLFDLLQVKFKRSNSLPSSICQRCLSMVEAFTDFRETVQKCEIELQRWLLQSIKNTGNLSEDQRSGLNGNPGKFEPEDDCDITEVNPEQDYESSEDEFSMESDTDMEDTAPTLLPANPSNFSAASLKKSEKQKCNEVHAPTTGELNRLTPVEHHTNEGALHADELNSFTQPSVTMAADSLGLELVAKNTYLCQYCDMAFTTQPDCVEHESRHDSTAPYVCSFCSLRTSSRQNLIYHIKELHDPERPYVCALCNKGFCRRSDLKKHTIVHTGVRPFTCPVCAKSFSRNTNLTKHMRIHNSIKPHVCQRCPRSFSTAADLVRHARSHTEIKPFQCSRCTASFTRKDKLQQHEQTHYRRESEFLMNQAKTVSAPGGAGIVIKEEQGLNSNGVGHMENIVVTLNPFGEYDSTQSNLTAQSSQDIYRQHSILAAQLQQRPIVPKPAQVTKQLHSRIFTCTICKKTFTRERDLQRHQALHLDMLFTCKQCGTGFNRREKLARHELEHHAPQYPCDICRLTFAKRDEFEMHMKMHELQQNAVMATQAALNASSGVGVGAGGGMMAGGSTATTLPNSASGTATTQAPAHTVDVTQRPSAADISFYSQLVPTMNLGFYSETRPEDRNAI